MVLRWRHVHAGVVRDGSALDNAPHRDGSGLTNLPARIEEDVLEARVKGSGHPLEALERDLLMADPEPVPG